MVSATLMSGLLSAMLASVLVTPVLSVPVDIQESSLRTANASASPLPTANSDHYFSSVIDGARSKIASLGSLLTTITPSSQAAGLAMTANTRHSTPTTIAVTAAKSVASGKRDPKMADSYESCEQSGECDTENCPMSCFIGARSVDNQKRDPEQPDSWSFCIESGGCETTACPIPCD